MDVLSSEGQSAGTPGGPPQASQVTDSAVPAPVPSSQTVSGRSSDPAHLARELDLLEAKFKDAVQDLKNLRARWGTAALERDRAMRTAWAHLDHRWFNVVLAGTAFFFILAFYLFSVIGWHHDRSPLPVGYDPVLQALPALNLLPVLTYGWLVCHLGALYVGVVFEPRRIPYFLSTIGLFVLVRAVFVGLNPVGAPQEMLDLNATAMFSYIKDHLAFRNEFFFSGHTGMPYLYFLLFHHMPRIRLAFLGTSIVMGASVLLTRNHYTIDVLGAFFMTYAIYRLSRYLLGFLDPLADRTASD